MVDKNDRKHRTRGLEQEQPLKFKLPGFHRHFKVFFYLLGGYRDSRQSYLDLQEDKVAPADIWDTYLMPKHPRRGGIRQANSFDFM